MESLLITVVIVLIAAASNWLQQRAQRQDTDETGHETPPTARPPIRRAAPPPAGPLRPRPESSLERELRRLLGDDSPPPTAKPPAESRPAAPPTIHRPVGPKVQMPAPPPQLKPAPVVTQFEEPVPALFQKHAHVPDDHFRVRPEPIAPPRPNRSWAIVKRDTSRIAPIFAVTKNPRAARDAFVASLVFGVPKSLEGEQ